MKKLFLLITIFLAAILTVNVNAANYELKELIPINKETTIVTSNFSYKGIQYNNENLVLKGVKNLTTENIPISISVGFFDKDEKNIGTINYCSTNDNKSFLQEKGLDSKEEVSYTIKIDGKYLSPKNKVSDIKYIAVLSDNINCRTTGSQDYLGQKVEKIGLPTNNPIDDNTQLLITIVELLATIIFLIFLYRFLFTNDFRNFDGEDVRREYAYINKKNKEERKNRPETSKKRNPNKNEKSEKIKKQEQEEKEKSKEESSLHKFYK